MVRGVLAAAWCLGVRDGAMPQRADARRPRQRLSPMQRGRSRAREGVGRRWSWKWLWAGLVRDLSGQLAGLIFRPSPGAIRWQSASGAPSALGSEESLWALAMDVLCLRLQGSGLEGSIALRWVSSGPGTMRSVRVSASVRCIDSERLVGGSGVVRARSGSRRWAMAMVVSSLCPSGRS